MKTKRRCCYIKLLQNGGAILYYNDNTEEEIPQSLIVQSY